MSSSFREPALPLSGLFKTESVCPEPESTRESDELAAWHAISDEEALLRLRNQDKAALSLLFDRYARLIVSIAARILRDRGEAEDVMQSLFIFLFEKADHFDPERGRARAWILQKAYSRALDRRDYLAYRQIFIGTDEANQPECLSAKYDLEREIDSKLIRDLLLKAIEELPEWQRRTLTLNFFEGLELREIAERLGEPLGQIRHHYYRGLNKLRRSATVQNLRNTQP